MGAYICHSSYVGRENRRMKFQMELSINARA
jgi:hypothetical protein